MKIMCLEAGVELVTELGVEGSTVDDEGTNTSHIANKPGPSMTHTKDLVMRPEEVGNRTGFNQEWAMNHPNVKLFTQKKQ